MSNIIYGYVFKQLCIVYNVKCIQPLLLKGAYNIYIY